jgi:hypothetical protein
MPLVKPSFDSKVPDYLLKDASDKDKYIIEQLSVISQTQEWLVDEAVKSSGKLDEVDNKLKFTNGKIASAITSIEELRRKNENDKEMDIEIGKIVKTKLFIQKYLLNRYSLATLFVFTLGLIKLFTIPELRELFFKIIAF